MAAGVCADARHQSGPEAQDDHRGPLQALGAVEGGEDHAIAFSRVVVAQLGAVRVGTALLGVAAQVRRRAEVRPRDEVRDPCLVQRRLDHGQLGVGPGQHGDTGPTPSRCARHLRPLGDPGRFVLARVVGHDFGDRPVHPRGARQHHFARAAERATLAQDGRRHRDHLGRAAVVLVEPDDRGAAQNVGQPIKQGGVGAVEPVHRLVRVADHEQVGLVAQHGGQQAELRRVDVLHLVDEQMPGAPADGVGELGVTRQCVGAGHDEVVEVEEPPATALRLVPGECIRHLLGAEPAAAPVPACFGCVVFGRDQARLGPTDFAVEGAGASGIAVRHLGQQPAPVGQELGEGPSPQLPMFPQQPERGAVEGAGLHPGDAERVEAGTQLLRCLAAERGDQGAVGLDGPLAHPPGHPQGQDPRLAGPGSRHDAEQGLVGLDGFALHHSQAVGAGEGVPGRGVTLQAFERHHHTPHGTEGVLAAPDGPVPMVAERGAPYPIGGNGPWLCTTVSTRRWPSGLGTRARPGHRPPPGPSRVDVLCSGPSRASGR